MLEVLSGQKTLTEASRAHNLHSSGLCRWKNEFLQQAHQVFDGKKASGESAERIAELERMVGPVNDGAGRGKKGFTTVAPQQRREMVKHLSQSYSIQVVCRVVEYSRSSY